MKMRSTTEYFTVYNDFTHCRFYYTQQHADMRIFKPGLGVQENAIQAFEWPIR
jgi:hypothetical protein